MPHNKETKDILNEHSKVHRAESRTSSKVALVLIMPTKSQENVQVHTLQQIFMGKHLYFYVKVRCKLNP